MTSRSRRFGKEAPSSFSRRWGKGASSFTCSPKRGGARSWNDILPDDITLAILQKVGAVDILKNIQYVCISWKRICRDPELWRSIHMQNPGNQKHRDLVRMTKIAIARSLGQLIDLKIENFGSDDLLIYLSTRKNLRSLRLVKCFDISDWGLSETVKRLPNLEELHIYFGSITNVGLELIGRNCPGLKSLTFNQQGRLPKDESDYEEEDGLFSSSQAYAIAKSMPELRHLSLFGNQMSNNGLKAILDSCPHLESLDLRQCFRIEFGDSELAKRCYSIKGIRPPNGCTNDYEFDTTIFEAELTDSDEEDYLSETDSGDRYASLGVNNEFVNEDGGGEGSGEDGGDGGSGEGGNVEDGGEGGGGEGGSREGGGEGGSGEGGCGEGGD